MASAFCSSADNPGLLGQLILATVAIHAARNSRGVSAMVFTVLLLSCVCGPGVSIFTGRGSFVFVGAALGAIGAVTGAGVCLGEAGCCTAISSTDLFL